MYGSATASGVIATSIRTYGWIAWADVPIAPMTSIRIGGVAPWVIWPRTVQEAVHVLQTLHTHEIPWRILGGGSNVLVPDEQRLPWVIVRLDRLRAMEIAPDGDTAIVRAGAGLRASVLVRRLARLGWSGLEFAAGIPGQIGGLVWMNAGAFTRAVADVLCAVAVWFPGQSDVVWHTVRPAEFGYRRSPFQSTQGVILGAAFRVHRRSPSAIQSELVRMQRHRQSTQPLRSHSAGCAFKNPSQQSPAGYLLEHAGMKGFRIGRAQFSPRHANFIINLGGATWQDVVRLIEMGQQRVWEQFRIWLEPEIAIWHVHPVDSASHA